MTLDNVVVPGIIYSDETQPKAFGNLKFYPMATSPKKKRKK